MTRNKNAQTTQISENLLVWYDRQCRILPWRVPPAARKIGVMPEPYHVWLSEIMLQQTTVITVQPYFLKFLKKWPKIQNLAATKDETVMAAWAGLGYYARARNLLKCARIISAELNGVFPDTEAALLQLPGIGPYTAAAIASIAFDQQVTVMDGNIERVMARLYCVRDALPRCKPELHRLAGQATPAKRVGDYVQALMDLGATVCKPRNPDCENCPLQSHCAAKAAGVAAELPARTPRKPKPLRHGLVYFAQNGSGQVLLETRPEKGLLGGMLALPSSHWGENTPMPAPPIKADWRELPEPVHHVFTHFKLILTVLVADIDKAKPDRGKFVDADSGAALPSVMKKAFLLALKNMSNSPQSTGNPKGR